MKFSVHRILQYLIVLSGLLFSALLSHAYKTKEECLTELGAYKTSIAGIMSALQLQCTLDTTSSTTTTAAGSICKVAGENLLPQSCQEFNTYASELTSRENACNQIKEYLCEISSGSTEESSTVLESATAESTCRSITFNLWAACDPASTKSYSSSVVAYNPDDTVFSTQSICNVSCPFPTAIPAPTTCN